MTVKHIEVLDYLIDVARQKSQKTTSHANDLMGCFQSVTSCFTMSRHDRALARHLPADRTVPLLHPEKLHERIIADPAGFGGIKDYAEAFDISPSQMAGILRGKVDIETDLSQMFALSEAVGLDLDIKFYPKEQGMEADTSNPPLRTEAFAGNREPAPRAD